jgi:hypothetical protein
MAISVMLVRRVPPSCRWHRDGERLMWGYPISLKQRKAAMAQPKVNAAILGIYKSEDAQGVQLELNTGIAGVSDTPNWRVSGTVKFRHTDSVCLKLRW